MLMKTKRGFLHSIGYLNCTKKPYKARFIANSSSCTTTELSKLLTSCLTTIKNTLLNIVKKSMKDPEKSVLVNQKFMCGIK